MKKIERQLTELILTVFLANGELLLSGDKLVKPLGLTSARWQILGALALAGKPLTVPQIAAAMGMTRQAVQKQINLLTAEKILFQIVNPGHRRSPHFELSEEGRLLYDAASKAQSVWVKKLAKGFSAEELVAATDVLSRLNLKLNKSDK